MTVSICFCQQCDKGSDCHGSDCCLWKPRLKKGECSPMGGVAAHCYTREPYAWTQPEKMVTDFDRCPCEPGLFCGPLGNGREDPKYGTIGQCLNVFTLPFPSYL
ncbi:prokineticin-2-like [Aplysia californica]|uniref:Prokineticin-2-like n=1 Tax=Aplysia californica TaxID=6500 RepID=A0ABM1ACS5_APLCA|nr:prokineticin-2-like [Aplysia californica]